MSVSSDDDYDEHGKLKQRPRQYSDWYVIKRIFSFITRGKYKRRAIFLLILSVVGAIIGYFRPLLIQDIINVGLGGGFPGAVVNFEVIRRDSIYMLIVAVLSIFLWFFTSFLIQHLANRSMFEMRKEMFDNLQRLSFDYYYAKDRSIGKLISYMSNDVETIQELVQSGLLNVIANIFRLVGALVLMVLISWKLTLVSFGVAGVILVVGYKVFKKARVFFVLLRRRVAAVTGHLNEGLSGMREIKAFAIEQFDFEQFKELTEKERQVTMKSIKLFSLMPGMIIVIIGVGLGIILASGGYFIVQRELMAGDVLAFALFLIQFMAPLIEVVNLFTMVQNSTAAGERIIGLIETKTSISDSENAVDVQLHGKIDIENVDFRYTEELPILKDFTMNIKPKERVAIIGYTGAGKTTIINLLMRFYDIKGGSIKFDGKDIKEIKLKSLRSQIGLVFQDNFLFSGTVKDNIKYGKPEATDEEVMRAAKEVGAHEFIMDLPKGYDTEVREQGNLLSVGQKQLIALARALLIDPPILILDEATSAVDPYSEHVIRMALEKLLKGRTSISIAHRLSTILNSDTIYVLDKGKIVEVGNHQSLLQKKGLYAFLYQMQFRDAYKYAETKISEERRKI